MAPQPWIDWSFRLDTRLVFFTPTTPVRRYMALASIFQQDVHKSRVFAHICAGRLNLLPHLDQAQTSRDAL